MKRLVLALSAIAAAFTAGAQEFSIDGSVELYSAYIWRGDKVCGTQFSPSVSFNYGGWTLQSFGFLAIDGSYKEIDWDLYYNYKDFSFHFADYFYHGSSYTAPENYFNFKKGESTHVLEGIVCYEPERLPIAARWFTFVFGSWLPRDDGSLGRNTFSSYLELEAFHRFDNGGKLSLFCGSSVLKGAYTNYTRDFSVIHLELRYTRDLDIAGARIPVTASYTINPYARTSFLNAGVGVRF